MKGQNSDFIPDTTVSGIKLFDFVTLKTMIPNINDLIDYNGPGGQADFVNKDATEHLICNFWSNGISEVHIARNNSELKQREKKTKLDIVVFQTESHIRLDMTKNEFIKIKGTKYKTEKAGDLEILKYGLNDLKSSSFLQKYHLPEYYADYTFKGGRLVKIDFGFPEP